MSRRFGRNQRRRAREREAALQLQLIGLTMQRDRQARRIAELTRTIDDVEMCLGPHFAGLPPREVAASRFGLKDFSQPSFLMVARGGMPVEMLPMSIESEVDPQHFLHVRLYLGDGSAAYCVSKRAIIRMPARVIASRIAEEFSYHLVDGIRKAGGR